MSCITIDDHPFPKDTYPELANLRFPSDLADAFPRNRFLDLLHTSFSLNLLDKLRILLELPALSSQQVVELHDTFEKERVQLDSARPNALDEELINRIAREWEEVIQRWLVLTKHPPQAAFDSHNMLTPQALHVLLDAHVIGQSHVTRELATLVYHQMLAYHIAMESGPTLPKVTRPALLAGYTGTGKTFTIQKICELAGLPFLHVNTASMVVEGIIGTSINDIGKDIMNKADHDVKRAEHAIVFLDEFDKTMSGSYYGSSVVNQLLRVIEGAEIMLYPYRYDETVTRANEGALRTNSMLFILGGAFQNLLESKQRPAIGFGDQVTDSPPSLSWQDLVKQGFPKELAGRINTILTLKTLGEEDYYAILTQSSSSPLAEYIQLVRGYGDTVHISDETLREIARKAAETGLGSRALNKIVYGVFKDILYEAPNPMVQTFVITREKVLDVVEGESR